MKVRKIPKILFPLVIAIGILIFILSIVINNHTNNFSIAPELKRTLSYTNVESGDEEVFDNDGDTISAIEFDAFFLRDTDGDGIPESPLRGTCNEIGKEAQLLINLNVLEKGILKNGIITINSKNFYLNTSILKDNEVANNYISTNTTKIELNEITNITEKTLIGNVRSGDYSSSSTITEAIGEDTSKYSMENSIEFSGTYVDSEGTETTFSKKVTFIVDWYGSVDANISSNAQTITVSSLDDLKTDKGLELDFTITTAETLNQLNMYGAYISGTIPELNGYKPTKVRISGVNVTYTYDDENCKFTATREAVINKDSVITSNAYTSSSLSTRYNSFNFTVVYPIEAYQAFGDNVSNIEISIPIVAVNKGFNNPHEEDGFENPYTSGAVKGTVVTTWKKTTQTSTSPAFNIYVGTYMTEPYDNYVVSKDKTLNIYSGNSIVKNEDTYLVQWKSYTGVDGVTNGIIMKETSGKTDSFVTAGDTYVSMEEITTNKGIYFSGATQTLGQDGWIKIYDMKTNALIEKFTSDNWNSYSSSNPYYYTNKVKHIRVETSSTNAESYFYVYNLKELDNEYITSNFTRDEFDKLSYIYSYLTGYMIENNDSEETTYSYEASKSNKALYKEPTSIATINIEKSNIPTNSTTENQKITIETVSSGYNKQAWKNGEFLVQLPSEIVFSKINNVTSDNSNVKISAYDLYKENGNYYIKILTENENEENYKIIINCNLTPDTESKTKNGTIKLYAINENAYTYYYSLADTYDVDGDLDVTELVNYTTTSLTITADSNLSTSQRISDYENETIVSPNVAKINYDKRTATISILAKNNHANDINDIKVLGVVPFKGNDEILSGKDLNSTYTTYMDKDGISVVTSAIKNYTTIYYSTQENPNNNVSDKINAWKLAGNVTNWDAIKTYLIVIDSSYQLSSQESIEFEYEITIPEDVAYNKVAYSTHAISYTVETEDGTTNKEVESEKLGLMVTKQYDLEITKYQKDTSKVLAGIAYRIMEEGSNTGIIKVTDENGMVSIPGLLVERKYLLKELDATSDYVSNEEEIQFYTYIQKDNSGNESLCLMHKNNDGSYSDLNERYSFVKKSVISNNTAQIEIENEVRAKLAIYKTDSVSGNVIKNSKFTLTGEGKNKEILTTDENGYINVSGIYLGCEYILQEIKTTGYYMPDEPIKFTITDNNGTYSLNYSDNNTTKNYEVTEQNQIPVINLYLENEKIATYGLQITQYVKSQGLSKTLSGVQYKIFGDGIEDIGKIYTTDESGVLTIDGLYEYVSGKSISGEYTISEIYIPDGYALNSTKLRFRAYRENRTLKMQILEGESVLRILTDEETGNTALDLNISNATSGSPMIQIGVEDIPTFTIFKYSKDSITEEKLPIPGTKFIITDLKGKYVTGSDGNIVGEWVDTTPENLPVPELTLTSTSEYKWTQREDGTWESTGNYHISSSISTLSSNNFELLQPATLVFDWAVSSQSESSDYLYYTITDIVTGLTVDTKKIGGTVHGIEYESLVFDNLSIDLPEGRYKIDFTYRKNNSNDVGLDAGFVKNIRLEEKELEKTGYYEVTTDENGLIYLNLPEGLYKAVETYVDDKYILEEDEKDRTYYFGVGVTQAQTYDWVASISGDGWDYINSVDDTSSGGAIGAGSFSEYSSDIIANGKDGIDVNKDGVIDKVSKGGKDGIIVNYDSDGEYLWSKLFGGSNDDEFYKVINTSDGGYAAVGYVSSSVLQLDDQEISDISKGNYGGAFAHKDAVLLKISAEGNYEWAVRIGGNLDDQINSLTETSEKNIVITGSYYSSTFNFYDSGASYETRDSISNRGEKDSFIASYSETGKYQWSQSIGGSYDVDAADVVEHTSGLVIAINSRGSVYTTTNATSAAYSGGSTGQIGALIGYDKNGSYVWNITLGTSDSYNDKVTSIDVTNDGNIIAGVNYGTSSTKSEVRIYKINVSGSTATAAIVYSLNGALDEYVADVKVTTNNGVLFGGWYYTSTGIDVDGDGSTTGEYDLPERSGEYVSDGYVIEIDSNGIVKFTSRLYGNGYDAIMGVAQTESGSFVSGGYFTSSSLTVTNCMVGNNQTTAYLSSEGNAEGFIATLKAAGDEIEKKERLEVENKVKALKITTQVNKNNGVFGGTIDGDYDVTYDGITYTEDGIRYIATVNHGEDSTREIKITPDNGYVIDYITINNVEYKEFEINDDGTVIIPAFTNVTSDMHVIVQFSDTISRVEVNHYLWTKEDGLTTTKVAESEYYKGDIGQVYEVLPKIDIDYDLITIAEYLGDSTESEDVYIPDNYKGTYTKGNIEKINYYYKEKTYTIIVHHYLEGTNESVPLKGSTTGEKVPDEKQEYLEKGVEYTTTQASGELIDYTIYELVELPIDSEGTIEENMEITYYYRFKTASLDITKVAEENHTITIGDTQFALYQLISDDYSNDELIDPDNVDANWKLVDTYLSSSTGLIELEDLPITSEYRLVETVPAEGRMLPDGQWKVEIIYEDYDENDNSIIDVNGTKFRITAIGNPPALIISDDGSLLLPNKQYYDLPVSGNFGTTIFYRIGMIIMGSGILLLVIRKSIIIKNKNQLRY